MNNATLIGRLTRDPEVRYSDGGTTIARYTLAVDRRFKQTGGQDADFIGCIAFGKTAEFIEKYFKQGTKMGMTGHIQTGSYTNKDGQKVYTTDVVAENVEFVESKKQSDNPYANSTEADELGFMNIPDGIDAELPFN